MAAPALPTRSDIVTEGLKRGGFPNPSTAIITRANGWMEEIKNDIWMLEKRLTSLQATSVLTTINGQGRYALPSDFSSDIKLEILYGSVINTAQAGTANTITLAATESIAETTILGEDIVIYAGTGQNSIGQCRAYNTTTKVATVIANWDTQPASGSSYMVIDSIYQTTQKPIWKDRVISTGLPVEYYLSGAGTNQEIELNKIPYNTTAPYIMRLRYYVDLLELDLTGTLMGQIYKRWRNVFISGIKSRCFDENGDNRYTEAKVEYKNELQLLRSRETYGMDLHNLSSVVTI